MKKLLVLVMGLGLVLGMSASAGAVSFGDGGAGLQGVLNSITTAPNANVSSVNVTTDAISDPNDSYWSITGTGQSAATLIIELAAFAPNNKFGIYQGGKYVQIFGGAASAGAQAIVSIKDTFEVFVNFIGTGVFFTGGNLFGYYLDSSFYSDGGLWHSDTSLNNDSLDHMAAYQGKNIDTVKLPGVMPGLWTNNEYILAFEDLKASVSDKDYTDFVVMVESVQPIPEPGTLILIGSGLAGLAIWRRRKSS
jgi:hypothetical protein